MRRRKLCVPAAGGEIELYCALQRCVDLLAPLPTKGLMVTSSPAVVHASWPLAWGQAAVSKVRAGLRQSASVASGEEAGPWL